MTQPRFTALPARLLCAAAFALFAHHAGAGFLEMPDTTEVPDMERESMLKDLDIPPVRERDPDPSAGPRLNITEFRVQGVVEYPELGITRESLNKLVEGIRFEMMGEGEMLDSGYTLEEMSEISDLVAQIEEETKDQHVGPVEVQRLVFLIREQRRRRGVTVGVIDDRECGGYHHAVLPRARLYSGQSLYSRTACTRWCGHIDVAAGQSR
jgi:hypothetical protein